MLDAVHRFPFGTPLTDTPPQRARNARAFVVGVYASAVHARWMREGKEVCKALAVAAEPCSFWDGSGAVEIIAAVDRSVPPEMGSLELPLAKFNGPSGATLRDAYLAPLGITARDCWITDLHDRYYLSPGNAKALAKYEKLRVALGSTAPAASLPSRPARVVPTEERIARLRDEFLESGAEIVITLGNEPICPVLGRGVAKLTTKRYGEPQELEVFGRHVTVLRLCHPRQAGELGKSTTAWSKAHAAWVERAPRLARVA